MKGITIPRAEFIREHQRLSNLLKKVGREGDRQAKELKEVKGGRMPSAAFMKKVMKAYKGSGLSGSKVSPEPLYVAPEPNSDANIPPAEAEDLEGLDTNFEASARDELVAKLSARRKAESISSYLKKVKGEAALREREARRWNELSKEMLVLSKPVPRGMKTDVRHMPVFTAPGAEVVEYEEHPTHSYQLIRDGNTTREEFLPVNYPTTSAPYNTEVPPEISQRDVEAQLWRMATTNLRREYVRLKLGGQPTRNEIQTEYVRLLGANRGRR
jgi:hypothetical protein